MANAKNATPTNADPKSKAYIARDKDGEYETIVFAENATKAKTIAQTCDACENSRYIDVRVHREPRADNLNKGTAEIDWYDPETRIALVRDLGWSCYETSWECDTCPAKQYCCWHEEEESDEAD